MIPKSLQRNIYGFCMENGTIFPRLDGFRKFSIESLDITYGRIDYGLIILKTIFRHIILERGLKNHMKKHLGIFCAAVMLFALMAVPMVSAEGAAQQKEVNTTIDLDSMAELPVGEVSTPYAVWTACGEASTAAPYSLVADDNGGKMVKYTLTGDPIMRHVLAFNVTAVPYSSVSVTFRTKTDGTLRPLIEAYSSTTGKRLGYMNTAKTPSLQRIHLIL